MLPPAAEVPASDRVILVNERDEAVGTADKLQAHREGLLHRAFSACLFNPDGDLLLQRRHPGKYHSGGLWSNTCCSHPRPGEPLPEAVARRLQEEMGIHCPVDHAFALRYRTEFGNGLVENELDHVFVGVTDERPEPNPAEVIDWRWIAPADLIVSLRNEPERYTSWFRLLVPRLTAHLRHDG